MSTEQIKILNKLNMVDSSDPNYDPPKRSGLEIALDALKKSNPNSPLIAHYEKILRRKNVDNSGVQIENPSN